MKKKSSSLIKKENSNQMGSVTTFLESKLLTSIKI